jgi:hypothetical protein
MNIFNIERAFNEKKRKGYTHIFFAIDLHDTIIPGSYTKNNEGKEFYPYAKEVLQWLTRRKDVVLILWTSSHKKPVNDVLKWLRSHGIIFTYLNENPLCPNTDLCDFSKKFYLSVILDDKAGFVGETDWLLIKKELQKIGEWEQDEEDDLFGESYFGVNFKKLFNKLVN